jgi:hypothetical protein
MTVTAKGSSALFAQDNDQANHSQTNKDYVVNVNKLEFKDKNFLH